MKKTFAPLALFLLFLVIVVTSLEYEDFILGEPVEFVKTDAGQIQVLMGSHDIPSLKELDVAVSSVILEPRALLLPHYMDASVVFYVLQGEGVIAFMERGARGGILKKKLKTGDVYSVPAGTVLYVLNTDDDRKLQLLGILDTSAALRSGKVEAFFVAGGTDPKVLFSGFRSDVLAAAFKVSEEEIAAVFSSQDGGAIVRTTVQQLSSLNKPFLDLLETVVSNKENTHKEKKHHKDKDEKHKDDEDKKHKGDDKKHKEEIFNLCEKRLFENEHGWIASTIGEDVCALSAGRFDVNVIHLKAGSLLAPHWNPEGAQFGMVTNGSGTIQIALANGSNGVDTKIKTGKVFYVPQFLPVSLVASQHEGFELVTFTVSRTCSTHANKGIQFLAGKGSIMQKMEIGILALALNLPDYLVSSFFNSQEGAVILPAC